MHWVLALALSAVAPERQEEKVLLQWKFQEGMKHRYRMTQKVTMDFDGTLMVQEQSFTYEMWVKGVDEKGTATVEMKYESMAVKATGLAEYEYDSEKDEDPPDELGGAAVTGLLGKSFTMKMTPSGRVVEVQGLDKLLGKLLEGEEGATPMLRQMLSDKSMKSMLQQMSPPLPEKKVGKGDRWKDTFAIDFARVGKMEFTLDSTLGGVKDGKAKIDQDVKIKLKPAEGDDEDPSQGGVEIMEMKGRAGTIFSIKRGLFLSSESTIKMKLSARGNEVPIEIEGRFELVENKREF